MRLAAMHPAPALHGSDTRTCSTLVLRPIASGDAPTLLAIFAATREAERAHFHGSAAQWQAFLEQQFLAQHTHYTTAYAQPSLQLVLRGEEVLGRLYVDRSPQEIRLLDIALLPEHRRQGTGRRLLQALIDESDALGIALGLHVEKNNPILDYYQRLGLVTAADRGVYWYMRRAPQPVQMPEPEVFATLVGTDFTLQLNHAAPVLLRLQQATSGQGLHHAHCSLRFTGPDIGRPTHETYLLSHERLGRFALFLGPVMDNATAQTSYQALITRMQPPHQKEGAR